MSQTRFLQEEYWMRLSAGGRKRGAVQDYLVCTYFRCWENPTHHVLTLFHYQTTGWLLSVYGSDLSVYHHEPNQIPPREILKKDLTGSKRSCNQCCYCWPGCSQKQKGLSHWWRQKADQELLTMLWRNCLRWLPPDCYLRSLWRGMNLTRCQSWSITINCFINALLLLVTIKLIS